MCECVCLYLRCFVVLLHMRERDTKDELSVLDYEHRKRERGVRRYVNNSVRVSGEQQHKAFSICFAQHPSECFGLLHPLLVPMHNLLDTRKQTIPDVGVCGWVGAQSGWATDCSFCC